MSYKQVQTLPSGLRMIEEAPDRIVLEYKSLNLIFFHTVFAAAYIVFIGYAIAFIVVDLIAGTGQMRFADDTFILLIAMSFAYYFSYSWREIIVTRDSIRINGTLFDRANCGKLRCYFKTRWFVVTLPYGAKDIRLPPISKNGIDVINKINDIIASVSTDKNSSSNATSHGEREQLF